MLTRLTAFAIAALASSAAAQDFRVYTAVRGEDDAVLSRSLTLFHAGKTYDHIDEVGEVVIGEPAQRRFTLLRNGSVGTRVSFDELRHFRSAGERETHAYAAEIAVDPHQHAAAEALLFQLDPKFRVATRQNGLDLTSPVWTYRADIEDAASTAHAEAYLDYADRAARLNYVLHPQSFYPAPREALDAELRERAMVPTRIILEVDLGQPLTLTAEHRYDWTLHSFDRSQIQAWQRLAESDAVEWVSFREYQSRLVVRR